MNLYFQIGRYRLIHRPDNVGGFVWHLENTDGEGMSMSKHDIEEMFDEYFNTHF